MREVAFHWSRERTIFLKHGAETKGFPHQGKMSDHSLLTLFTKNKFQWVNDLNVNGKTIKAFRK